MISMLMMQSSRRQTHVLVDGECTIKIIRNSDQCLTGVSPHVLRLRHGHERRSTDEGASVDFLTDNQTSHLPILPLVSLTRSSTTTSPYHILKRRPKELVTLHQTITTKFAFSRDKSALPFYPRSSPTVC